MNPHRSTPLGFRLVFFIFPAFLLQSLAVFDHLFRSSGILSLQIGYVVCWHLAAPTSSRWPHPRRSQIVAVAVVSLQFITVDVIFLSKWGSPGHTGWCRGIISGTRDQARAPLKTTHDPHCFVSHFACYLQLLPFCHAHRAAQYCFLFHSCLAQTRAQPNILFSIISLLSAARLLRSPIFCFR